MKASKLEKVLKTGRTIDLGNLHEYLQAIAEDLQGIIRWEAREKIAGQSVRENDLQHTFKVLFLTLILADGENKYRKKNGLLDIGILATMALVHDIGEITEKDRAYFLKMANNRIEDIEELRAFCRIAAPLPEDARNYLIGAMMQTMPGSKEEYINTREARFFNAVENLVNLKRGLYECSQGNLHFAPKCLDWHIDALKKHAKEFPSLKNWYKPYIETAQKYLVEFNEQRENYIAEFVKRGGQEQKFPF